MSTLGKQAERQNKKAHQCIVHKYTQILIIPINTTDINSYD